MGGTTRHRLPGDKIQITDWQPPSQSMMASQLMEVDQLKSLQTYVANVEAELESHNELKHAIELAVSQPFLPHLFCSRTISEASFTNILFQYSFRASNYYKAMSNWQRKSEYLLREIVKFRTYIESLVAAASAKDVVLARRAERDAELAVIRSNAAAAVTAATVGAASEKKQDDSGSEEVERLQEDSDGMDEYEEAVESRDVTPRQSSMPPTAAVQAA